MRKSHPASSLTWHCANLLVSMLPALVVGMLSLKRSVLMMGSDQDLMWASEAMRLLRGVGPSYADHPGAFWAITYALTIKALTALTPLSIVEAGELTNEGLKTLISTVRIESSLIAGLAGYMCSQILIYLRAKRYIAISTNFLIAGSNPILFSASSIRHEVISMVLLLSACLALQGLFASNTSLERAAKGIGSVLLIFLAAFSKQQSLIVLPFFGWIALATNHMNQPSATKQWLDSLRNFNGKRWGTLLASCTIIWLISAAPDIDLINLPFWVAINLFLFSIISAALIPQKARGSLIKAVLTLAFLEIVITRVASANWWRQAVTGFPSWLLMFKNNSQGIAANKPLPLEGLDQYFGSLFSYPDLTARVFCIIALLASCITICQCRRNATTDQGQIEHLFSEPGWMITAIITGICLARINPPYAIYFLPCIAICSCISLNHFSSSDKGITALTRKAMATMSGFLLIMGLTHSAQNLNKLDQISQTGLPESSICMGHNMDISMGLTAVGNCPDFEKQAYQKRVFDSWWTGPR